MQHRALDAYVYTRVYLLVLPTKTPTPAKKMYALRLDPELAGLLKALKERDGIPESEQIRRALRLWFEQHGMLKRKPPSKARR